MLQRRKAAEIAALEARGLQRLGTLNEQAFLAAGAALYAGEGTKAGGMVAFANSDPEMISFFCAWLRRFFSIDEARLTMRVYLHEGLDLDAAQTFWSEVSGIPVEQFRMPYRAPADATHPPQQARARLRVRAVLLRPHAPDHHGIDQSFANFPYAIRGSSIGRAADC